MNENKIGEKYLPIGTVLLLKDATKRVFITGYKVVGSENKDKVFDYAGYLYPEGNIGESALLFDHSQIVKIFHEGYRDEEYKKINETLLKENPTSSEKSNNEPTISTNNVPNDNNNSDIVSINNV